MAKSAKHAVRSCCGVVDAGMVKATNIRVATNAEKRFARIARLNWMTTMHPYTFVVIAASSREQNDHTWSW